VSSAAKQQREARDDGVVGVTRPSSAAWQQPEARDDGVVRGLRPSIAVQQNRESGENGVVGVIRPSSAAEQQLEAQDDGLVGVARPSNAAEQQREARDEGVVGVARTPSAAGQQREARDEGVVGVTRQSSAVKQNREARDDGIVGVTRPSSAAVEQQREARDDGVVGVTRMSSAAKQQRETRDDGVVGVTRPSSAAWQQREARDDGVVGVHRLPSAAGQQREAPGDGVISSASSSAVSDLVRDILLASDGSRVAPNSVATSTLSMFEGLNARSIVWEVTPEFQLQGMAINTSSDGNNCCLHALGPSLMVPPAAARIYLTECFINLEDYDLDKDAIAISLLSDPDRFKSREALFKATTNHLQKAGYLSAEILALALRNDKLKPDADRIFADTHYVFLKETTNRTIATRQCEVLNSSNPAVKEFAFVICNQESTHFERCVFPQVQGRNDFPDLYCSLFMNGSKPHFTAAQMKLSNSKSYSNVASSHPSRQVEWDSGEEEDFCWMSASKDISRAQQTLTSFDMQELREIQVLHREGNLLPPLRPVSELLVAGKNNIILLHLTRNDLPTPAYWNSRQANDEKALEAVSKIISKAVGSKISLETIKSIRLNIPPFKKGESSESDEIQVSFCLELGQQLNVLLSGKLLEKRLTVHLANRPNQMEIALSKDDSMKLISLSNLLGMGPQELEPAMASLLETAAGWGPTQVRVGTLDGGGEKRLIVEGDCDKILSSTRGKLGETMTLNMGASELMIIWPQVSLDALQRVSETLIKIMCANQAVELTPGQCLVIGPIEKRWMTNAGFFKEHVNSFIECVKQECLSLIPNAELEILCSQIQNSNFKTPTHSAFGLVLTFENPSQASDAADRLQKSLPGKLLSLAWTKTGRFKTKCIHLPLPRECCLQISEHDLNALGRLQAVCR
jgi:hypothetical protein